MFCQMMSDMSPFVGKCLVLNMWRNKDLSMFHHTKRNRLVKKCTVIAVLWTLWQTPYAIIIATSTSEEWHASQPVKIVALSCLLHKLRLFVPRFCPFFVWFLQSFDRLFFCCPKSVAAFKHFQRGLLLYILHTIVFCWLAGVVITCVPPCKKGLILPLPTFFLRRNILGSASCPCHHHHLSWG